MPEITLHDLALDVINANPTGTKMQWGEALAELADDQGDAIAAEVTGKLHAALGGYVANIKGALEAQRQHDRSIARGITPHGRLLTPTISVRTKIGTQLTAWYTASPHQFVEAVYREQAVISGRNKSNQLRLKVAEMCTANEALMALDTLTDVCREVGIDPADLELGLLAS